MFGQVSFSDDSSTGAKDEKKLKVIGCMYSCGFPNTIQHVQRDLQLNDARAVTCVMERVEKDDGDGARKENGCFTN